LHICIDKQKIQVRSRSKPSSWYRRLFLLTNPFSLLAIVPQLTSDWSHQTVGFNVFSRTESDNNVSQLPVSRSYCWTNIEQFDSTKLCFRHVSFTLQKHVKYLHMIYSHHNCSRLTRYHQNLAS